MERMDSDPIASDASNVSVVIPTYRRGAVLLDTLKHLIALDPPPAEIVVVDQTEAHPPKVAEVLRRWEAEGRLRRIVLSPPSIPQAMNAGLLQSRGEIVLFVDDDIVPAPDLVKRHWQAYAEHPDAWAVAGRVIQPEDRERKSEAGRRRSASGKAGGLRTDLDFAFNETDPAWVENVMAGNLSVLRAKALAIGGFDANFIPPVSFRFETEFAKRLTAAGGKIYFEPRASIQHLRAGSGGTRTTGSHLASASPRHGVGDYYYALRWGRGGERFWHIVKRPFREVRTKFHLAHPWFIPVKFVGELRAMALAFRLYRAGPRLIEGQK